MRKTIKIVFLFSVILTILNPALFPSRIASADTPDPVVWQNTATGLSVTSNDEEKTAGLGFQIRLDNGPFFSLPGGVESRNSAISGPIGIDLGIVVTAGDSSSTLTNEAVDWAHNEMTFSSSSSSQLTLWVSRLTPAILVQSSSVSIRLFTGDVSGNMFDGSTITPRELGPAYPKYVAFQSGGKIQTQALSQTPFTFPSIEQNWLLLWYGNNSHFVETKKPLSYTHPIGMGATLPQKYAYQADAPILVVLQKRPATIKNPIEGGVEISFDNEIGSFTFTPLFGREHLSSADTDKWSYGLPDEIIHKAQWWAQHLCDYPIGVNETYDYDKVRDTAIINEIFTFKTVCSGGIRLAPLPPILSIASNALHVTFSSPLFDGNLYTEFGPYIGIESVDMYSWRISGLKKYIDGERVLLYPGMPPPDFPNEIEQELESQVGKVIDSSHLAPWIFTDEIPRHTYRGDIYWLNPADEMYHVIEIAEALPDGDLKTQLINYIGSERYAYPPEDLYNLPLDEGTVRTGFASSSTDVYNAWLTLRPDVFLKRVPLYNFYSLAQYYKLTGEAVPAQVWQKALSALDQDMREQDWASLYWFRGLADRRDPLDNANRQFSGLVGFIRLSEQTGDEPSEELARALLAKAAVLRLAMAEYPRYLYSVGLAELPLNPDWQVTQTAGNWLGNLFNYKWINGYDDARQVIIMDQFGIYLYDNSGFMEPWQWWDAWNLGPCSAHLTPYRDMTPELARFLSIYAKEDSAVFDNLVKKLNPHWYAAFGEGTIGSEHNLSHPIDSFQVFMSEALIHGETPQILVSHIDISWLDRGDLFYMHKIAESIKAYRWTVWNDSISLRGYSGDQQIIVYWQAEADLPDDMNWQLEYSGPMGDQPSPIKNIAISERNYTLTGLRNGSVYTIILKAMMGNEALLISGPIKVMPVKYKLSLPLIIIH